MSESYGHGEILSQKIVGCICAALRRGGLREEHFRKNEIQKKKEKKIEKKKKELKIA